MCLSKAVSLVVFFGALAVGMGAAYVVGGGSVAEEGRVDVSYRLAPVREERTVAVRVEDLVGVWRGTWGYGRELCTIEIKRIDGNKFYGTLRKEGAVITLAGTFDAEDRRVFFHETKVVSLGEYSEWSLGTNNGTFSPDGRTLTGDGIDRWGTYGWDASKE